MKRCLLILIPMLGLLVGCSTSSTAPKQFNLDFSAHLMAPTRDLSAGDTLQMLDFAIMDQQGRTVPPGAILLSDADSIQWGQAQLNRDLKRSHILTRDLISYR